MGRQRVALCTVHCALCIGLNYSGTSAELAGCVNDAMDWGVALTARGYVTNLVLEPTKAMLVDALRTHLSVLRFGDRFVFTYSGHGTWVPDTDGDEPDGRDEALCPADYTSGVLTDDELHAIFGEARFGVRRLILSDSCHSGSVARIAPVVRLPSAKPRFLPPGEFLDGAAMERARAAERLPVIPANPRKGTVLISGCADTEYSYDANFDGRPNGAFSYWAIRELAAAQTIRSWHQAIRSHLPSVAYPQSPELTALAHQRHWAV